MIGAIRTSTLQLSSSTRTRRVVLLTALHIALCTSPLHAQQTRDRWSDFRLLAQQELRPGQPSEEDIWLPTLKVFAPARLLESLQPLSSIPASIQIIPGDEVSQAGTPSLQEYLTRLPGVTLTDLPLHFGQATPYNSLVSLLLEGRKSLGVPAYILCQLPGGGKGVPNASRIAF
jgi:hypothetical protein